MVDESFQDALKRRGEDISRGLQQSSTHIRDKKLEILDGLVDRLLAQAKTDEERIIIQFCIDQGRAGINQYHEDLQQNKYLKQLASPEAVRKHMLSQAELRDEEEQPW